MNKAMIITKIKHWQAELREMIETLNRENKGSPIAGILRKREEEIEGLIEAIGDKSFIPRGDVSFEPEPVIDEIAEKVKKVKEGVLRLKELKRKKKEILQELEKE